MHKSITLVLISCILLFVLLFGCSIPEVCGNGVCETNEKVTDSCTQDCESTSYCGDGICNGDETSENCLIDCLKYEITCNSLNGNKCEEYQVCDGKILTDSQDTYRCCSGECKLPKAFDWRNRHGTNWNTPIRNQENTGACTLFGGVVPIETLINLYYNQKLDIDLSEQYLTSCVFNADKNKQDLCSLINSPASISCEASLFGIPDQECYLNYNSMVDNYFVCDNLCEDYLDRFWKVNNFSQILNDDYYINFVLDENNNIVRNGPLIDRLNEIHLTDKNLKENIILNGAVSASNVFPGHTAAIVGWEVSDFTEVEACSENSFCSENNCLSECQPNEEVCRNIYYSLDDHTKIRGIKQTYDSNCMLLPESTYCEENEFCVNGECIQQNLVQKDTILCVGDNFGENSQNSRYAYSPNNGETIWIIKNSLGLQNGEKGYNFIRKDAEDFGSIGVAKYPIIPPINMNYSIICSDNDHDKFCNWGISKEKPITCPAFCKQEKDWDDSDSNIGALGTY